MRLGLRYFRIRSYDFHHVAIVAFTNTQASSMVKILTSLRRWDVTHATLEMEDFKYKSMPSKALTVPLADVDAAAIATCAMNKHF